MHHLMCSVFYFLSFDALNSVSFRMQSLIVNLLVFLLAVEGIKYLRLKMVFQVQSKVGGLIRREGRENEGWDKRLMKGRVSVGKDEI